MHLHLGCDQQCVEPACLGSPTNWDRQCQAPGRLEYKEPFEKERKSLMKMPTDTNQNFPQDNMQ